MRYYEVFVAEPGYQKREPLTYSSADILSVGSIISVPYGKKVINGFIVREVPKPTFKTRVILAQVTSKPLPQTSLRLHAWLLNYYPSGSGAVTQLFIPSGLAVRSRSKKLEKKKKINDDEPPLTVEQQQVLNEIINSKHKTFLLHGETGSGKTRVYFELVLGTLNQGKSALILTPEISLVPQIEETFRRYFDDQVIVLHSGLTKSSRTRNWLKLLLADEPKVLIGTRSSLFAPIQDLGLVVVDEMHEPAYKQESAPKYQALRLAAQLAKIHGAQIVYGSATPPIVEYYVAEVSGIPILRMASTAKVSKQVKRTTVDLKNAKLFSRHRYLSDTLLNAVEHRLHNQEQSLLFLNRRGTARQILCQQCGWQAMCPRCDTPLTYHGDDHSVRCHTCGYRNKPPMACIQCRSDDIIYRSLGTKALVDALHSLFPEALIKRFDTDNVAAEQLTKHFESVQKGEVDILVGTQMLGKGLDLPKLSLVGIINADTGLAMPDFSSSERSYQLLHQAIGRVGRGHELASGPGEVIVQSFNPDSPLLQSALKQDWHNLYKHELAERKQFSFPPYCFLLKITVSRKTTQSAENFIFKLFENLRTLGLKIQTNEPTPSFYERTHGKYNWQMVVKAKSRPDLITALQLLPPGDWTYDLDPINLL